jgi:UDP-sugar transporter A1/2/3
MSQLALPAHQENLALNAKSNRDDIEFEELGLLPADLPPVPSLRGIPLKYIS